MRPSIPRDSILFIGDIQGCLDPLVALLDAAQFDARYHRLIPVGDVINRGPNNIEVLALLKKYGATPILGNHEAGLLKAIQSPEMPPWAKTQTWYGDLYQHPDFEKWLHWIQSWPIYQEGEDWIAVHGGLHPQLSLEDTPDRFHLSVRVCDAQGQKPVGWDGLNDSIPTGFKAWHDYYKGMKTVIYGHWARQGLHFTPKTRGLDSGSVYGLKLSALWWPQDQLIQVDGYQP